MAGPGVVNDFTRQLVGLALSIVFVAVFAVISLNFAATPSYPLVYRPTPTPTPEPFYVNDPRLTNRTLGFDEAQAVADFKLLRPARGVTAGPTNVVVSEFGAKAQIVRQSYEARSAAGGQTNVFVTQTPGPPPFRGGFQSQQVTSTVTLNLVDGRQQVATVSRSSFGVTIAWNDTNGYVSVRAPAEAIAVERLVDLASSMR